MRWPSEKKLLSRNNGFMFRLILTPMGLFLCKDILKIDNLWSLVNLTKLQMDNNIVEKIEGLDMLVNLEWLGMECYITCSI